MAFATAVVLGSSTPARMQMKRRPFSTGGFAATIRIFPAATWRSAILTGSRPAPMLAATSSGMTATLVQMLIRDGARRGEPAGDLPVHRRWGRIGDDGSGPEVPRLHHVLHVPIGGHDPGRGLQSQRLRAQPFVADRVQQNPDIQGVLEKRGFERRAGGNHPLRLERRVILELGRFAVNHLGHYLLVRRC